MKIICGGKTIRNSIAPNAFLKKSRRRSSNDSVASSSSVSSSSSSSSSSVRSSSSSSSSLSSTTEVTTTTSVPIKASPTTRQSSTEQHLAPLSILLSTFIVDSARTTYLSLAEHPEQQATFLRKLKTAIRGEVIAPLGNFIVRDLAPTVPAEQKDDFDEVIAFLVATSNSTLGGMATEKEQNVFKQHLRNGLRNEFVDTTS